MRPGVAHSFPSAPAPVGGTGEPTPAVGTSAGARRRVVLRRPATAAIAAAGLAVPLAAPAQEIEPRAYSNAPVGARAPTER
jgi:hypothetical protein